MRRADTEEKIEELWEKGYNDEEIAEMLGNTLKTVRQKRRDLGLYHREITKNWLKTSGVGDEWDEICRRLRNA